MMEKQEKEKNKDALKITHQSRARNHMVYDLKGDGNRLTLCVFARENASDTNEWRIEARSVSSSENAVVSEWGATKVEALREAGRAWAAKAPAEGLPNFDWEAVAQALIAVRAL